jgi:hypothetical protein
VTQVIGVGKINGCEMAQIKNDRKENEIIPYNYEMKSSEIPQLNLHKMAKSQ